MAGFCSVIPFPAIVRQVPDNSSLPLQHIGQVPIFRPNRSLFSRHVCWARYIATKKLRERKSPRMADAFGRSRKTKLAGRTRKVLFLAIGLASAPHRGPKNPLSGARLLSSPFALYAARLIRFSRSWNIFFRTPSPQARRRNSLL